MLRVILVGLVGLLIAGEPASAGVGRDVQARKLERRPRAKPAPKAKKRPKKKPNKKPALEARPKRTRVAKKKKKQKISEPRRPMP